MIQVYRLQTNDACPVLKVTDPAVSPEGWVRSIAAAGAGAITPGLDHAFEATISRPPDPREFCTLVPGALAIDEEALGDPPNDMYYALWWETQRIDLRAGGRYFAFIVPRLTLAPDLRTGAPCQVDYIHSAIFRIAGRPLSELYCTAGIADGGVELPATYHAGAFLGLDFELIWEGDPPPPT